MGVTKWHKCCPEFQLAANGEPLGAVPAKICLGGVRRLWNSCGPGRGRRLRPRGRNENYLIFSFFLGLGGVFGAIKSVSSGLKGLFVLLRGIVRPFDAENGDITTLTGEWR